MNDLRKLLDDGHTVVLRRTYSHEGGWDYQALTFRPDSTADVAVNHEVTEATQFWPMDVREALGTYPSAALEKLAGEVLRENFVRASHLCICERCGKDYLHHPLDPDDGGCDGPVLHVLCDGTRVKL
jgi:hypothetical protein